jgi:hypothetical protein
MQIIDVVGYVLQNYPKDKLNTLSKSRLSRLTYLIDWEGLIKYGRLISPINWVYSQYGPYTPEIEQAIKTDDRVVIEHTKNAFHKNKQLITLKQTDDTFNQPSLQDKQIIDFAINKTQ